jgi:hypothetical protein
MCRTNERPPPTRSTERRGRREAASERTCRGDATAEERRRKSLRWREGFWARRGAPRDLGWTGMMGHGSHSRANGPPWTCENIRKAHIRLADDDAPHGPIQFWPPSPPRATSLDTSRAPRPRAPPARSLARPPLARAVGRGRGC